MEEIVLAKYRSEAVVEGFACDLHPLVYAFTSHEMDKLEHYWKRVLRQDERDADKANDDVEFEEDSLDKSLSSFSEAESSNEDNEDSDEDEDFVDALNRKEEEAFGSTGGLSKRKRSAIDEFLEFIDPRAVGDVKRQKRQKKE
jgi:hypothetical protein